MAARKSREKRISGIEHLKDTRKRKRARVEGIQRERQQTEEFNGNLERAVEIMGESIMESALNLNGLKVQEAALYLCSV